jgi:GTP cyclohydrolase II
MSLVKSILKYVKNCILINVLNVDPSKKLTLRVHDECNGSDVFGNIIFL